MSPPSLQRADHRTRGNLSGAPRGELLPGPVRPLGRGARCDIAVCCATWTARPLGRGMNLRTCAGSFLHMIEETARPAGHLDIARGADGRPHRTRSSLNVPPVGRSVSFTDDISTMPTDRICRMACVSTVHGDPIDGMFIQHGQPEIGTECASGVAPGSPIRRPHVRSEPRR